MSKKKIKVYGALNEELEFKVKDRVGIIGAIFDNRYISSCVLTFEDGMIMYARLCDNNIIGVHVVEKGEVREGDKK
jgi:hypothetical protein